MVRSTRGFKVSGVCILAVGSFMLNMMAAIRLAMFGADLENVMTFVLTIVPAGLMLAALLELFFEMWREEKEKYRA